MGAYKSNSNSVKELPYKSNEPGIRSYIWLETRSTADLRELKKRIEEELSKRHKAKEEEKCSCWTCGHCFYDENAHPSYRWGKGGYKCMAWSKKGKIIPTKHKAPIWCPEGKGVKNA